jgi:hypothetical protein
MQLNFKNRRGLAMPMTLLFIVVLSASLAAGLSSTTSEIVTNTATRGQARAYNLAQSGLEQFLVRRNERVGGVPWCTNCVTNPAAADSEWTRVTMPGGYADVMAVRVRPMIGNQNAMYFIRSKGIDTSAAGRISSAAGTYPERTVGVYATWNTATIQVKAAWLSLTGLLKNGTGVISGVDQCGAQPDVAGVMVPKGDLVVNGNSFNPGGSPPVDTMKSFLQLKAQTNIDWAGIMSGGMAPDVTIPGGTFPPASAFDNDPDYWPVIRITTNGYSLPNRGRGTIIADSDFVISGSNMWDGIVLVGGRLTSNGNNTTAGATLSGLNFLIGGTPSNSTIDDATANGQKTYVYNSCNVEQATTRLRRYAAIPNSWVDNVASW